MKQELKKETRKPVTMVIRPTIKDKARVKAAKEGKSLSYLVDSYLEEYIKTKS